MRSRRSRWVSRRSAGGGDPALTAAVDSVLAKITAILPDGRQRQLVHAISQVFRPEPRYDGAIDLAELRTACWREEAVRFAYRDEEGRVSERTILPLTLVYNPTCVTVLAWCCLRDAFRMFRTDRMSDVRAGGASFRPRRVVLLREYVTQLRELRERRADRSEAVPLPDPESRP